MGALGSSPFFAAGKSATTANLIHFSYLTQTTVGYGDFTAGAGLGRALAVGEALIGQLYLVAVVALVVSNMGPPEANRAQKQRGQTRGEEIARARDPAACPLPWRLLPLPAGVARSLSASPISGSSIEALG